MRPGDELLLPADPGGRRSQSGRRRFRPLLVIVLLGLAGAFGWAVWQLVYLGLIA